MLLSTLTQPSAMDQQQWEFRNPEKSVQPKVRRKTEAISLFTGEQILSNPCQDRCQGTEFFREATGPSAGVLIGQLSR